MPKKWLYLCSNNKSTFLFFKNVKMTYGFIKALWQLSTAMMWSLYEIIHSSLSSQLPGRHAKYMTVHYNNAQNISGKSSKVPGLFSVRRYFSWWICMLCACCGSNGTIFFMSKLSFLIYMFCFFTDGKKDKEHKLNMITITNHAPQLYMTWLPVSLIIGSYM